MTGVNIQFACTLQQEQKCGVIVIKLLYVHQTEYPETDVYRVLVF